MLSSFFLSWWDRNTRKTSDDHSKHNHKISRRFPQSAKKSAKKSEIKKRSSTQYRALAFGMRLPLRSLRLLPFGAGTVWLITLLALLIRWLAEGRPRYPAQSNLYVAYISSSFRLKPLFIVGAILTSLALVKTVITVHLAFHQPYSQQRELFPKHR